jgi:hypothetical protein
VPLEQVVLGATASLTFGDYAEAPPRTQTGRLPTISNSGTSLTELKADTYVGSLLSAGTVVARNRARVASTFMSPALDKQIDSEVSTWVAGSPQFRTFTRLVEVPPLPDTWVSVERRVETLSPGGYGNYSIKSDGSLVLQPGRYFFRSLALEPDAPLVIGAGSGSVYVYVENDFTFRGLEQIPENGPQLFVGVLGTGQALLERSFRGTVVASRGSIVLADVPGRLHTGQFFAKSIEVRSPVHVQLETFGDGLGDGADECTWGRESGAACAYDVACPGQSERRCVDSACTCVVGPGGVPTDGCSQPTVSVWGVILENLPLSFVCDAGYGCASGGVCDGNGYCVCPEPGTGEGTECTEPTEDESGAIRPVADGTSCVSYTGSCIRTPTCAGGVCACSEVSVPDGQHPDCQGLGNVGGACVSDDCLDAVCTSSGTCVCAHPRTTPFEAGAPIRVGTVNVQAFGHAAEIAGCNTDMVCKADGLADKVLLSGYDVLLLEEAFDEEFEGQIVKRLHDGGTGPFPYVVAQAGEGSLTGLSSGLMLLSRWPFSPRNTQDDSCFDQGEELHVIGEGAWVDNDSDGDREYNADVQFEVYDDTFGIDGLAQKGIVHAGIDTPYGKSIQVFVSHTQANAKTTPQEVMDAMGGDAACIAVGVVLGAPVGVLLDEATEGPNELQEYMMSWDTRARQLSRANELVECVAANHLFSGDSFMLGGDLNINGDLSNPWAGGDVIGMMMSGQPDGPLWERPVETRDEWDRTFNWNTTEEDPRILNARGLVDSWAHFMTPQCVADDEALLPPEECRVIKDDHDDVKSYQDGLVSFDRGATQSLFVNGEERLDYLLVKGQTGPVAMDLGSSPQHVSRAFNLQMGEAGPTGFTRSAAAAPRGTEPLTDHHGLNAELDDFSSFMSPADAKVITVTPTDKGEGEGAIDMEMPYPTGVHWFKITEPGDYVFVVNPKDQLRNGKPGRDNGLTYQVFENIELSLPLRGYKSETITVPPQIQLFLGSGDVKYDYYRPGYEQARFASPHFPLWVKVFAEDPAKLTAADGRYVFYYHRATCSTAGEACTLRPYGTLLGDEHGATAAGPATLVGPGPESWFEFRVELPDINYPQTLGVFAADLADSPVIESVTIIDAETMEPLANRELSPGSRSLTLPNEDPSSWNVWGHWGEHWGTLENSLLGGEGTAKGKKYYLRVVKRPGSTTSFQNILAGYQTNLTWILGSDLSGTACQLKCEEESEWGHDEIWISLIGENFRQDGDYVDVWPQMSDNVADGIHIRDFNGGQSREWTHLFFNQLADRRTHPDGTSFRTLQALGFINDLDVEVGEDDYEGDDAELAHYHHEDFPPTTEFISGRRTLTWDNTWPDPDGKYFVEACAFSRDLPAATCTTSAECGGEPYRCRHGICEYH